MDRYQISSVSNEGDRITYAAIIVMAGSFANSVVIYIVNVF